MHPIENVIPIRLKSRLRNTGQGTMAEFEIIGDPSLLDSIYGKGASKRERERMSNSYGFMDEAVPFSDEMYGGINALMDMVRSGEISWDQFKKLYAERKGIANQAQEGWRERNPNMSIVADVAGGLTAAPARVAATSYPLLRAIGTGGAAGAAGGFDEGKSASERLSGAQAGAAIGAVAGGVMHTGIDLVGRLANALSPGGQNRAAAERARRAVVMALERDGINMADITRRMTAGKPLTMADFGPNSRALIGAAYRAGGDGKRIIEDFFEARTRDQLNRLTSDLATAVGEDPRAFGVTADALDQTRRANANALYGSPQFRAQGFQISSASREILNTPAGKAAARAAATAVRNKRMPVVDQNGDYTVEFLDQVQRQLRGRADVLGRAGNRAQAADYQSLRNEFVQSLPDDLRNAMRQYREDSELVDALDSGRAFMRGDVEGLGRTLADMSEEQRRLFRLGAAREVRGRMARANDNADATRMFRNEDMRERLSAIFGDEATFRRFMDNVAAEEQMQITRNTVLKGSQTGQRAVEDAAFEQNNANAVADVATRGLRGGLRGAVMDYLAQRAHGANRRFIQGMNERVADRLAPIGTETRPLTLMNQVMPMRPRFGTPGQQVSPSPAAGLGALGLSRDDPQRQQSSEFEIIN